MTSLTDTQVSENVRRIASGYTDVVMELIDLGMSEKSAEFIVFSKLDADHPMSTYIKSPRLLAEFSKQKEKRLASRDIN